MDRRHELALFVAVALIGGVAFGWFYADFPTSTVPIEHSKGEAGETAAAFLDARGYDVSGYRSSAAYAVRGEQSTYFQRVLPRDEAREAVRRYGVQRWEVRYYRPLEQEEFVVSVDPTDGDVVGFEHRVPDEAPGERLSAAAARESAERFLREQGHDLGEFELVTDSTTDRAERRDHAFVWEHATRTVDGAPYRVEVEVHGGRIGGYDASIDVPDGFTHTYRVQQGRAAALGIAFLVLSAVFVVGAVVYALRYYKRETFDARFALGAGGVVAGLSILGVVNTFPQILHAAPTTMTPLQYLLIVFVGADVGAAVVGTIALITTGAGKELAAEVFDYEVVTPGRLRESADARRRVALAGVRGFCLGLGLLGFYAVFYLIGTTYFDVWLPASSPYVTAVATYVPAVVALTTAGTAAVWEEAAYRLFAVPFAERYLRYTALAVVVPAFVWGLGHSGYAVLPFYARVIEVTLIGIVLGAAFLRYGIGTTVGAHFTLNALAVGVPMLLAGAPGLFVHGVLSVLIALGPLLVAVALVVRNRRAAAPAP